ncbi:MAG: flagellar brake protein [Treponema sp.]|nr:flagellar brake protein [Treponema sp.]MCL2236829.1 flagellar brake protein [Treponema sp.]
MIDFFLHLPPLQQGTLISMEDPEFNSGTLIGMGVILAVIVIVIIIGARRPTGGKRKGGGSGGGSAGGGGLFASLAVHKIARNLGLNSDQANMLVYVFKTDGVIEPEKSVNTPALLDRHFRRTYREIENGKAADSQRRLAILFSTRNALENSILGGISSTRQLRDDILFTINTGKEKINVRLASAKGDYLFVETPKNVLGSLIKIAKGTRITVMFFTKSNKGFSFETRVIGYSSYNGHPIMQLAHSNHLRFLSQRRYRRRHSVIACSLYLVYVEGTKKKQRLVVDKRRLQGSIQDISMGGCSMKMMAPIRVGARFKIEFIQGDVNVAALGQVLRTNKTGLNTIIHVKFLKIPLRSMNLINAFVYEYGRE